MTVSTFHAQRTFSTNYYSPTTPAPDLCVIGQIVIGAAKIAQRTAVQTFDLAAVPQSGPPLPANAVVSLAELLANVTSNLGDPWTIIAGRLDDDRADYDDQAGTWEQYKTASRWRTAAGDDAPVPAPVSFPSPTFLGDGVITDDLAPFVTYALQHSGKLLQLRYRISLDPPPNFTESYTFKCSPPEDADITRLRITWGDPLASPIDHPQGVTLPGAPPAPAARPSAAGGASTPAPPARPNRNGGRPRTPWRIATPTAR